MNDFKALSIEECIERILAIENPLLIMHANPDADTVGSCAALADVFEMLGKEARYLCADKIPRRLEFLLDRLKPAESLEGLSPIAVDIASTAMLGSSRDILVGELSPRLMIDHHEVGEPFADCYKIPGASSTGEVIFDIAVILEARGKIRLTKTLAEHLFAAMSSDTGAFRYSNATEDTYRKAGRLVALGADHAKISHLLYFSKSEEQIRAEGITAERIRTALGGRVAYSSVTRDKLRECSLTLPDFDTGIDIVRSLIGVEIALFAKEIAEGEFKISLRSTGQDVASIAASLGGGGHVRSAGCTVKAANAEGAIRTVIEKIEQIL